MAGGHRRVLADDRSNCTAITNRLVAARGRLGEVFANVVMPRSFAEPGLEILQGGR